ncbi:MAG TPA: PAS domain-containing protein [Terriglobales bacterium]|nr:PAS domain-containing protein [Terriglobales bacterium]
MFSNCAKNPDNSFMGEAFPNPESFVGGIFHSPGVGVAVYDNRFRYRAINEALASINGVPARAHLGKTLNQVLGDFAAQVTRPIEEVFLTAQPVAGFEIAGKLPTRNEPGHWVVNYFPIKGPSGRVEQVGLVVVETTHLLRKPYLSGTHAQSYFPAGADSTNNSRIMSRSVNSVLDYAIPDLFGDLHPLACDRILKAARQCTYRSGHIFCQQGMRLSSLYVLINGTAKMSGITKMGKEVLVDWIQPGEAFGLAALSSSPTTNPWTIYGVTSTQVLQWDSAAICSLADSYPKFYANAMAVTLRRAQHLQKRFEELSTRTVEERLAQIVCFLADRCQIAGHAEIQVSDEELAQMMGTNLYTVNKLIRSWQTRGYVKKTRRRLSISDRENLVRISGSR